MFFSLACIGIATPTPGTDLMSTVIVLQTDLVAVQTAAAAPTLTPPAPSTPLPGTLTQVDAETTLTTPTPTSTSTLTPTATRPGVKSDRAEFVSETIKDKTVYAPGTIFRKSWRLINRGTTIWTTSYALVFVDGNLMGAPESNQLPQNVAPNQTITLSINLKAPDVKGEYKSYWKLRNADGVVFGLGEEDEPIFADIIVGDPWAKLDGAIQSVIIEQLTELANPYDCYIGAAITFKGDIIVNQPAQVEYIWRHNGVNLNPPETYTFTAEGETAEIYHEWLVKQTGLFDIELVTLGPETVLSNKLGFEVNCK